MPLAWTKPSFIGREALLAALGQPLRKELVTVVLDDPAAYAWGGETLSLSGEPVGELSSAGWGWAAGRCIALGYVRGGSAAVVHAALGVVYRLLARHLAALAGLRGAVFQTSAVTIIQRFGAAANFNVHFHCLVLDGAYRVGRDGRPCFVAATAPTPAQLQALLAAMIARLMRLFVRRGVLVAEPDRAWGDETPDRDDEADRAPADLPSALPVLHLASTAYRIATGPWAGRRIVTLGGGFCAAARGASRTLCAGLGGFSLQAAPRCR
ncbi:MAG: transposase [Rhodobacter sp.]|nr:transposase [Rhodobacter sp.]